MHAAFPLPDPDFAPTREFWAAAARRELRMPRCGCGAWRWYPAESCAACGTRAAPDWELQSGRARLFSWCVVRHVFLPHFAERVPYVTGLVVLEESKLRLATEIVDCAPEALAAELPLEVAFRALRFPGVAGEAVAPCFRPRGGT